MIVLRPFDRSDFPRLIGWATSPAFLLQWAGPLFTYPLDTEQSGAIACYERAGFVAEVRLREARRLGEEYWTLVQMRILEQEWRARSGGADQQETGGA